MFTFILILLLVAAIFGILGAVLKAAFIIAFGLILAFAVLTWGGWWYAKRRMRVWQRELDLRLQENDRRRRAIDVRHVPNEADRERAERLELEDRDRP